MSNVSLLIITRGREQHLHHLLKGVAEQNCRPREIVIVFMNEPVPAKLPDPGCVVYPLELTRADDPLPLAAARNFAAGCAAGDVLAFLDADCVPAPGYVEALEHAVNLTHGLVMADLRYLAHPLEGGWTHSGLEQRSVPHPSYPPLPHDHGLLPLDYGLFRAAAFGIRAGEFARLGGFDESLNGYGGEATDLAYTARKARLPAYRCNARAYHQHHPVHSPPYDRLNGIVANARRFYDKWDAWPMQDWLEQFHHEGLIEWDSDRIEVIKQPAPELLNAPASNLPF